MLRVVGIILLGIFALVVVTPLILKAVGIVVITAIGLAILLIKLGVVFAIGYLILVGVRAVLR
ncbi:MAG: hypothetical protein WCD76_09850 [Pyrinomonadaceae bacterium]